MSTELSIRVEERGEGEALRRRGWAGHNGLLTGVTLYSYWSIGKASVIPSKSSPWCSPHGQQYLAVCGKSSQGSSCRGKYYIPKQYKEIKTEERNPCTRVYRLSAYMTVISRRYAYFKADKTACVKYGQGFFFACQLYLDKMLKNRKGN